ncbi:uncharacterized protein LOC115286558 isoform X2 [Suricata suricatta]|uniref:uncharacterized protein LOC115286558 isoform X2 n=2 Tax=Suricata suricatta TaxID=37032 RepID=UPI001155E8EB|nr:uncharacterized protein LOC115286558 isoform X2 [Suricata suricatta]
MVMGRQPEAVMGIGSAVTASLSPVHLLASLLRDVQHTEDGTAENRPYCPPRGAGLAPGKRRGLWWTWQSADPQNPRGEAQGCREQTPCKAPQRKSRGCMALIKGNQQQQKLIKRKTLQKKIFWNFSGLGVPCLQVLDSFKANYVCSAPRPRLWVSLLFEGFKTCILASLLSAKLFSAPLPGLVMDSLSRAARHGWSRRVTSVMPLERFLLLLVVISCFSAHPAHPLPSGRILYAS